MKMLSKLLPVFVLIFWMDAIAQQNNSSFIVLELFTSQGCSSCPPADRLLDITKENYADQNVYVLSYHVDYWNRLGWKDPFSKATFSDYQRSYAQQFRSRSIYTPQLVVNGSEHFTGSDSYKLNKALQKYSNSKIETAITISEVKQKPSHIDFEYQTEGKLFSTITWVLVVKERITKIARGENRNRTLKNTNIVANRKVAKEKSAKVSLAIPQWVSDQDELSIIGYTQDDSLKITAAIAKQI